MKIFKLDDKSAEAMVSVLNAVHPDATFVQEIIAQYNAPAEVVEIPAEAVKEVVAEEAPAKKAK
jgi:hypothetical protein